jgi:hypothetical protein
MQDQPKKPNFENYYINLEFREDSQRIVNDIW